jgi:3-hydroxy-3-methylglutaryl CoA synthase/uncharacterized OB-fold protein
MAGISACGVHVPRMRLPLSLIHSPEQRPSSREKVVAGADEDSITMAVAAAGDCLGGCERAVVDHLYLVSTSSYFAEKSAAAIVAKALGLRPDVLTVDYGGSLRGAAAALRAAVSAVASGAAGTVLVVASDARTAEPYSAMESELGDAAVALLVEADAPLRLEGDSAVSRQAFDVWRDDGTATLRSWEDRFVTRHGCIEPVTAAWEQLRSASALAPESVRFVACHAPDARSHRELAGHMGFRGEQVIDPLFGQVGNCGSAFVPLLLAQALERAQPGDRVLTAFAGDGAHLMSWVLERPLERTPRLSEQLQRRIVMRSYRQYLQCRGLDPGQRSGASSDGISATVSYRDQDADIGFVGARCCDCGTEQYPPTRVCYRCFARDRFEPVALARRTGTLLSYSMDYFFPAPNPPVVAGVCALGGSARAYLQLADYAGETLQTGLPVEFVFRRIHHSGGRPAYFWKSRLIAGAAAPALEPGVTTDA